MEITCKNVFSIIEIVFSLNEILKETETFKLHTLNYLKNFITDLKKTRTSVGFVVFFFCSFKIHTYGVVFMLKLFFLRIFQGLFILKTSQRFGKILLHVLFIFSCVGFSMVCSFISDFVHGIS